MLPSGWTEECSVCVPLPEVELCGSHASEEASKLSELEGDFASEDEGRRIEALEAIASLTRSHTNAPSRRVAQCLARRLDEETPAVRKRAAELLADGQHPAIALDALLSSLKSAQREVEQVDRAFEAFRKKWAKLTKQKKLGATPSMEEVKESMKTLAAMGDESQALKEEMFDTGTARDAMVTALGKLRDERATKALLDVHRKGVVPLGRVAINEALLEHGTRGTLKRIVGDFKDVEKAISRQRKELEKERRARLPKAPSNYKTEAAKRGWEQRVEAEREQKLDSLAGGIEAKLASLRASHDRLLAFALSHGLPDGPAWSEKPYLPWTRWLDANADALPESLGRLPGT